MTVQTLTGESPFDALKRVDEHGEHWSARDLQTLSGYSKWQDFEKAIERAMVSANNIRGVNGEQAVFTGVHKNPSELGGRPRTDYRMNRYACYLTFMNGDPRKPEIAAAQAYFAVMTRKAEVAEKPKEPSKRELAMMVIEAEDAREAAELAKAAAERQAAILNAHNRALEAREREAKPKVASYEQLMEADGTYSFAEAAKMLPIPMGQNRLFALLREKGLLIEGRRDPYQQYIDRGYFELRAFTYTSNHGPVATTTTRITPKGLEYIRKTVIGA